MLLLKSYHIPSQRNSHDWQTMCGLLLKSQRPYSQLDRISKISQRAASKSSLRPPELSLCYNQNLSTQAKGVRKSQHFILESISLRTLAGESGQIEQSVSSLLACRWQIASNILGRTTLPDHEAKRAVQRLLEDHELKDAGVEIWDPTRCYEPILLHIHANDPPRWTFPRKNTREDRMRKQKLQDGTKLYTI